MTNAVNVAALGSAPAFSAFNSTSQTISTGTITKVVLDTESFDTNSNFASNRFTPTVAGYYQINGSIFFNTGVTSLNYIVYIYKNGSAYRQIPWSYNSTSNYFCGTISDVISMNGTTDYIELYVIQYSGGNLTLQGNGSSAGTYMSGAMVRSA